MQVSEGRQTYLKERYGAINPINLEMVLQTTDNQSRFMNTIGLKRKFIYIEYDPFRLAQEKGLQPYFDFYFLRETQRHNLFNKEMLFVIAKSVFVWGCCFLSPISLPAIPSPSTSTNGIRLNVF